MEENWKQLLKWDPKLVIVNQLADTFMVDPEHPCVKLSAPLRLRLIGSWEYLQAGAVEILHCRWGAQLVIMRTHVRCSKREVQKTTLF